MLEALLLAFVTVFVAELGDKSQLLALSLASRYRAWLLVAAVTTSSALTVGVSALVGTALGAALPTEPLLLLAAGAFAVFAVLTWREDGDRDGTQHEPGGRRGFLAVVSAISLAELGDKTMFAVIALAAAYPTVAVWAGATVGMSAAGGLAVVAGRLVWKRLSPRTVRHVAAGLFAAMALLLAIEALR